MQRSEKPLGSHPLIRSRGEKAKFFTRKDLAEQLAENIKLENQKIAADPKGSFLKNLFKK